MWKYPHNTGFHARISTTASGNEGIGNSPAVEYNVWYYISYHKSGQFLTLYYDGVVADQVTLSGQSVANNGALYFGKDPWYNGIVNGGYDNIQVHNRALSVPELNMVAAGQMLSNDNSVLLLDFNGESLLDVSYEFNHASVVGNPVEFTEGGSPVTEYTPEPSYMTVNGANYLAIDHTADLALGENNGDFTVSLALIQTQDCNGEWKNVFHKGNNDGERTPAMWKYPHNTGFHARISTTASNNEGINNSPAVEYNRWYYISYHKSAQSLTLYYDGDIADQVTLSGQSVANNGPLYFGRDPWWNGIIGGGYDNVQVHNRALTVPELNMVAAGQILTNDGCVLALDFLGGSADDLSTYGNHAQPVNNPAFTEGGSPLTEYTPQPSFMSVNGANYLAIAHTAELALGADNGDFTVSLALIQTQDCNGEWKNVFHKGNNDGERTPAMWKYPHNTGFHARISTTAGGNEGINNSPAVDYNRWYYIAYHKEGQVLTVFYDGEVAD